MDDRAAHRMKKERYAAVYKVATRLRTDHLAASQLPLLTQEGIKGARSKLIPLLSKEGWLRSSGG